CAKGSYEQNINPEYLEINFGNECNFKCGYCHPKYSTRFYQEIKEHGPVTSVKNHRCDIDWMKLYQREEENPYVDAFWKWWPELRKTLNIMRITGGEPTMHRSTYQVLDEIDKDPMPWLELNINSNLGTKTALVEKMSKAVRKLSDENKIRSFKLFSSIDGFGRPNGASVSAFVGRSIQAFLHVMSSWRVLFKLQRATASTDGYRPTVGMMVKGDFPPSRNTRPAL
ncbi:hypothetical protein EBT25_12315, partial [bacterium]|nr:hypothetical protein [bacterium]